MKCRFKHLMLLALCALLVLNGALSAALAEGYYLAEVQRYGKKETIGVNDKFAGNWNLVAVDRDGRIYEGADISALLSSASLELPAYSVTILTFKLN